MSKHEVNQLEEVLPDLDVEIVGDYDEYFVVNDGQFRWTGYCADVTRTILRRVKKAEEAFNKWKGKHGHTYTGYDELCNRVDYIEDEKVLAKVESLYGDVSSV